MDWRGNQGSCLNHTARQEGWKGLDEDTWTLGEQLWACRLVKDAALSQAMFIMAVQCWCQGYAQ